MHPATAKRRKVRVAGQIQRRVDKIMRRLPECEWVLAYRFLGESTVAAGHEWHAIATRGRLAAKAKDAVPGFEAALEQPDDVPTMPRNSVVRASQCRAMLKDAWLEHVRGTPFEGRVQMYSLVAQGACDPFPWWSSVVGDDVAFANDSVNRPEVSTRIWEYLAGKNLLGKHHYSPTCPRPESPSQTTSKTPPGEFPAGTSTTCPGPATVSA